MINKPKPTLSAENAKYCQFICKYFRAPVVPFGKSGRIAVPEEILTEFKNGIDDDEKEKWFRARFKW